MNSFANFRAKVFPDLLFAELNIHLIPQEIPRSKSISLGIE
nr:30S ribosomal protein S7 [Rhipidosiphon lewmanomontiae]